MAGMNQTRIKYVLDSRLKQLIKGIERSTCCERMRRVVVLLVLAGRYLISSSGSLVASIIVLTSIDGHVSSQAR